MATYTYTDDPANKPLDEARLLLVDMGTSDDNNDDAAEGAKFGCLVSDEVILYYISKAPGNIYRACQYILNSVISGLQGGNQRYKTLLEQTTGDRTEKYGTSGRDAMTVLNMMSEDLKSQELAHLGMATGGLAIDMSQENKPGFSQENLSLVEPWTGDVNFTYD